MYEIFIEESEKKILKAELSWFRYAILLVIADLFPLGLSIATLVLLSLLSVFNVSVNFYYSRLVCFHAFVGILLMDRLFMDFALANPFTSRPPFEIGFLVVMSILWLCKSYSRELCET